MIRSTKIWMFWLLTALAGVGLIVVIEGLLSVVPGLGPEPLVVVRAAEGGRVLHAVNRRYSQRFFFGQRGQLAAAGQMAERFFVEPAAGNRYRVVFVGASTVQGFPHPRRLAAASFLQAMLSDAMPARQVEVFNLGITSIASFAVAEVVEDALVLEPDQIVVYTGHNEFYGIYGVGDHATPWYNRLDYSLRQLHLTHVLDGLIAALQEGDASATDLLKIMAQRGEVPLSSPRRRAAEDHLRENLLHISQICKEAQVPLMLCTLAANDAGFAPVGSSLPDLGEEKAAQWSEWVGEAAADLTGDYIAPQAAQKALEQLERAAALSSEHAWPWYLRGRALARLDREQEAHRAFRKARNLDLMPWRAPTAHSEIIRAVAASTELGRVVLLDVEAAFGEVASARGVDWQLMVDHVHFSVSGQALLARALLHGIKESAGDEGKLDIDLNLLRGVDAYRQQLGDLPAESVLLYKKMAEMLSQAPMDRYNGHNARYFKQLTSMQWQRLTSTEQRGIKAWTQGEKQVPLALTVADQLFEAGDFTRAQAYYNASRLEAPFTRRGDLWAAVQWAWSIEKREIPFTPEQKREMQSVLERASFLAHDPAIDPYFIDYIKGQLHHLLDERDLALVHLERAFLDRDFRRKYLLSLFHALAAELVSAGRLDDARRYALMAGEESNRPQYFLQMLEAFSSGEM